MKKQTHTIALCGMMAAMSVVIMLLGGVLQIGTYAAPMFAGLCLLPVGRRCGRPYQIALWVVVSALSLMVVPDIEESLLYLGIFGCYPVIRPGLEKLPKLLRILGKFVYFNVVTVVLELLVMWVLVPEAMSLWFGLLLLLLGNVVFWCYDFVIPRVELRFSTLLDRLLRQTRP